MGLFFDELNRKPIATDELEDFQLKLDTTFDDPQQIPTVEEYELAQEFIVNEAVDSAETISLKRQGAALATEIAISGGGQVAGALATGGTASTGVGVVASPFVWIGTTFSTGYAANVAAQAIEDPNGVKDFSHGRAIAAGLINTIPFVGKFTKGTKAARIAKSIAAQTAQGGTMAVGDTAIRVGIDEQRLPTYEELKFALQVGAVTGGALGTGIEGAKPVVKKLSPSVKRFYGKIAGKTPDEIDAMVKSGDLLPEDIDNAVDEIGTSPEVKPPQAEQPLYKIKKEDIGDINQRSLQEIAEDIDPKDLEGYADQLANHPEIVALRQKVDIGETTLSMAGGQFDDAWQKQRNWLGKVDELYGTGAPRKEKKALIIAGGTASGKSTIADQDAELLGAKVIDSDYAKELLPEYDGGAGAPRVHVESKAINKLVLGRALEAGDNVILPVVGSSGNSIEKTVQLLKSQGYEVAFKYVDIPEATAQARNFRRIHRTGRFIDPKYVTKQYKQIAGNYEKGKNSTSTYQRVTNSRNTIEVLEESTGFNRFFESGRNDGGGRPIRGEDAGRTDSGVPSQEGATAPDQSEIIAAIDEVDSILVGQTGGRAYNITKRTKDVFRKASQVLVDDLKEFGKTGDVEVAKRLIARLPNYIIFDNKMSQKDFAQGTGLKANDKNAELGRERLKAGITAKNQERTLNLRRLQEMLQEFVDDGVVIKGKDTKGIQAETQRKADGVRLTKEERLDEIQAHIFKTYTTERTGTLQKLMDAYFSVRLVQLLNSFKTATVGTVSAGAQTVLRPVVNTVVNTRKLLGNPALKDASISRKVKYAMSDIIATQEYMYLMTKHLGNTMRSVRDTVKNRGESAFLFLDKHSYVQGEIKNAQQLSRSDLDTMRRASRRNDARIQKDGTMKTALQLKAKVLNNPIVRAPMFFYDYGLALIGGFEEFSLIAHSLRAQRARGIKKGIEEGADDLGKYADDYVESAIDRSTGTFKARYDAGFAEDFNFARKDHFRRLDVNPDDIRKGWDETVINTLQKISKNPDEAGILVKVLYPILGVPLRAVGYASKYVPPIAAFDLTRRAITRGAGALEKKTGEGVATLGKFDSAISQAEADIRSARETISNPASSADEIKQAKNIIRDKEGDAARLRDQQITDDYEALAFASIGMAFFMHSYFSAKQGEITGTLAMFNDEQKKALFAAQGAPQAYKMENIFGNQSDYRYADPIKLAMALGADVAHRQELEARGLLSEDQKGLKGYIAFGTNFTKAMATEMPTSRGVKNLLGIFSTDPDKQLRGVADLQQSLIPIPAEIRRFRSAEDDFVSDRSQGNPLANAVDQALGTQAANYRLSWLGEPKARDAETVTSYLFTMGAKEKVEVEPIDKVFIQDAIAQQTISDTPTTINRLALKDYINEKGETLYSLYGRIISTSKIGGRTVRQRLNTLVSTPRWKTLFKEGYDDDPMTGQITNPAIEEVKEIVSQHRNLAKEKILYSKIANGYYNKDKTIYNEMDERKKIKESKSTSELLEVLNIE